MSTLAENIDSLCKSRGISGYRLCKSVGISPNFLTELRNGRRNGISAKNADKIAAYFGVSVGFLLGTESQEQKEKLAPISESELDAELIRRLSELSPEERKLVDGFVQGILAKREAGSSPDK